MIGWMIYGAAIGALLGVAAWSAERALRGVHRPARWVWAAALLGSVALPQLARLGLLRGPFELPVLPALVIGDAPSAGLEPARLAGLADAPAFAWGDVLLAGWLALSMLLLLRLLVAWVLARRASSGWRVGVVQGVPVWVARSDGPAVVGWLRSRIVVPEWALALDDALQRLMLRHEQEHVRAGDPPLLLLGLLCAAATPWNPVVWWQLRRLRLAVEADCDERVLRAEPDVRRYGALLLEVGRHHARSPMYAAALTEPKSMLERRLELMTTRNLPPRLRRAFALLSAAVLLVVLAVCAEQPLVEPEPSVAEAPAPQLSAPKFTPFTVAPELANRAEVVRALEEFYPPLLREAGIAGTVHVWFYIDESGVVQRTQIKESSTHEALDQAALRVADVMRFTPALNRDRPTAVWVALPIVFRAAAAAGPQVERIGPAELRARLKPEALVVIDGAIVGPATDEVLARLVPEEIRRIEVLKGEAARAIYGERGAAGVIHIITKAAEPEPREEPRASAEPPRLLGEPAGPLTAADVAAGPTFTPFTQRPELANRAEVAEALQRYYPPLLKDAGIGGRVDVWFLIDRTGEVVDTRVRESSGHGALDQAALAVARTMEFTPAENRGAPTAVWVALPIMFQVR